MTAPWKRAEKKAAALVGGKRHIRGRFESAPDVDGGRFSAESKWRSRLPVYLAKAMAQAEKFATPDRPPIVYLWERLKRRGLVVMRSDDFRKIVGGLSEEPVEPRRRRPRKGLTQPALFAEVQAEAAAELREIDQKREAVLDELDRRRADVIQDDTARRTS